MRNKKSHKQIPSIVDMVNLEEYGFKKRESLLFDYENTNTIIYSIRKRNLLFEIYDLRYLNTNVRKNPTRVLLSVSDCNIPIHGINSMVDIQTLWYRLTGERLKRIEKTA